MNNFNVLLRYSLKPKITSKKAMLGIAGIFFFVAVLVTGLGYFASTLIDTENPMTSMMADEIYIYPDNQVSQILTTLIPQAELTDQPQLSQEMIDDKDEISLINTETNVITSNYQVDTLAQTTLTSFVMQAQNAVALQSIPLQYQTAVINSQVPPNFEYTGDESENNDFLYGVSFVSTLLIYLAIVFGIQLLGSEIFEEKNSRAMEIIITNVKPAIHMLVKITSTFIFILAIALSVVLGLIAGILALKFFAPDTFGILIDALIDYLQAVEIVINGELFIFIIFVGLSSIFAILLFQILAAVTAAMTTSYEDYQKANGPVIILLLIPYFVSIFNIEIFSKIFVYIPFFTPFFAPKLYLSNEIGLGLYGIAILIQLITILILFKVTSPIYREGLLNYSTSSLKQIVKRAYQK